ncbi:hypothetical protein Salat_2665200 [Sesamum alatum]|uniref:Uncharacterized protein n=1 Tax=Sesamum alatum TaxID=300844 RepID=A0AAE2CB06_9LAMI|nr:hypothetical protein Salat_2665200 [Sesamum alatum]
MSLESDERAGSTATQAGPVLQPLHIRQRRRQPPTPTQNPAHHHSPGTSSNPPSPSAQPSATNHLNAPGPSTEHVGPLPEPIEPRTHSPSPLLPSLCTFITKQAPTQPNP